MTDSDRAELTARFDDAMLEVYVHTSMELGWRDRGLFEVVRSLGGFATARMLLGWPDPSEGFAMLCAAGRLDLSTEYLVLCSPWRQLFTAENLEVARERLRAHHGAVPSEVVEVPA